jgi:hypothetical protein
MSKTRPTKPCALCGQSVEIAGFNLTTPKGLEEFCCAGCLSIYELLGRLPTTTEPPLNSEDNKK